MSSDNILLNSPALHSLKRNQLVQLCKRHGIKAIGKNPELIGKLQEYGRDHPSAIDSQLGSGEGNAEETHSGEIVAPRPSETWSLIEEPPEQEYRTHFQNLSTINEFGTGESSSKSSSVTSSIKALATLLHGSFSSSKSNLLASSSMTSLPAPTETYPSSQLQHDDVKEFEPFNEPEPEPEPNTSINSVYMNEAGLASTVRLVGKPPSSPDYAMPSPFRGKSVIFPSSSPISPTFDKTESFQTPDSHSGSASSDHVLPSVSQPSDALPGTPDVHPNRQASPKFNLALTHATTEFTFRSPMPGVSMDEAKKASLRAEILQEMNRRLLVNDLPATVTVGFFNEASKKRAREPEPAPEAAGYSRFVAAHEREFNKMPSILDDRARVRARQRLSNSPRKSSLAGVKPRTSHLVPRPNRTSFASRGRTPTRPSVLQIGVAPLAGEERAAKRARTSMKGIAPSIVLEEKAKEVVDLSAMANKKIEAAVTAAKRKSMSKARVSQTGQRRRSSVGRRSLGKNAVLGSSKPKGLMGRFGFLKKSAKSVMKSVFTAVVGGEGAAVAPAGVPPTRESKDGDVATSTSSKPAIAKDTSITHAPNHTKPTAPSVGFRPAKPKTATPLEAPAKPSRPAPPIPSQKPLVRPSIPSLTSTTQGRSTSSRGSGALSTTKSSSALGSASSARSSTLYSRSSRLSGTTSGTVSSIGLLRKPNFLSKNQTKDGDTSISTLFAPTASSLAKTRAPSLNGSVSGSVRISKSGTRNSTASSSVLSSASSRGLASKFGYVGNVKPSGAQPSSSVGRSTFSPTSSILSATPSKLPVAQGFKFKSSDFAHLKSPPTSLRCSAVRILSPNSTTINPISDPQQADTTISTLATPAPTTLLPKTGMTFEAGVTPSRRPRISRSKVIAKLGEQRERTAGAVTSPAKTLRLSGVTAKRTSLQQARPRRSMAAADKKTRAILDSYARGQRRSDVLAARARRKSGKNAKLSLPGEGMTLMSK